LEEGWYFFALPLFGLSFFIPCLLLSRSLSSIAHFFLSLLLYRNGFSRTAAVVTASARAISTE
jgi:hypothetical protein